MSILVHGQPLPSFCLPKTGGGTISSAELAGRQAVLFFYPKADTSACTVEAIAFSNLAQSFAAAKTVLLGISADTLQKQEKFRKKHELVIPLISDDAHILIGAFGLWVQKQLYGRKYMGIERTTVLVDGKSRIAQIWAKVSVAGHAQEVLAAAESLGRA